MGKSKFWGTGLDAARARAIASLSAAEIEIAPFTEGVTNKTPNFLALQPNGQVHRTSHDQRARYYSGTAMRASISRSSPRRSQSASSNSVKASSRFDQLPE